MLQSATRWLLLVCGLGFTVWLWCQREVPPAQGTITETADIYVSRPGLPISEPFRPFDPWVAMLTTGVVPLLPNTNATTTTTRKYAIWIDNSDSREIKFPCREKSKEQTYQFISDCMLDVFGGGRMLINGTDAEWGDYKICRTLKGDDDSAMECRRLADVVPEPRP